MYVCINCVCVSVSMCICVCARVCFCVCACTCVRVLQFPQGAAEPLVYHVLPVTADRRESASSRTSQAVLSIEPNTGELASGRFFSFIPELWGLQATGFLPVPVSSSS